MIHFASKFESPYPQTSIFRNETKTKLILTKERKRFFLEINKEIRFKKRHTFGRETNDKSPAYVSNADNLKPLRVTGQQGQGRPVARP